MVLAQIQLPGAELCSGYWLLKMEYWGVNCVRIRGHGWAMQAGEVRALGEEGWKFLLSSDKSL